MASGSKGELVPVGDQYPIVSDPSTIASVLAENVSGGLTVFDLDRIKVPSGGGLAWEIPTLEGKPEIAQSVEGIIVSWREPRAYWKESFASGGGGNPPDCASNDGSFGVGDPGIQCAVCPNAQFGTAVNDKGERGRGQACKQMRLLFVVRPGELLPVAMFLPPTSLGPIRQYFLRLSSKSKPYYSVVTAFELQKKKNAGGIEYASVVPRVVRELGAEEVVAVKEYSSAITDALNAVQLRADDVADTHPTGFDDGQ